MIWFLVIVYKELYKQSFYLQNWIELTKCTILHQIILETGMLETQTLTHPVCELMDHIWTEAAGTIEEMISLPLRNIKVEQVWKHVHLCMPVVFCSNLYNSFKKSVRKSSTSFVERSNPCVVDFVEELSKLRYLIKKIWFWLWILQTDIFEAPLISMGLMPPWHNFICEVLCMLARQSLVPTCVNCPSNRVMADAHRLQNSWQCSLYNQETELIWNWKRTVIY